MSFVDTENNVTTEQRAFRHQAPVTPETFVNDFIGALHDTQLFTDTLKNFPLDNIAVFFSNLRTFLSALLKLQHKFSIRYVIDLWDVALALDIK